MGGLGGEWGRWVFLLGGTKTKEGHDPGGSRTSWGGGRSQRVKKLPGGMIPVFLFKKGHPQKRTIVFREEKSHCTKGDGVEATASVAD